MDLNEEREKNNLHSVIDACGDAIAYTAGSKGFTQDHAAARSCIIQALTWLNRALDHNLKLMD